MFQDFLTLLRVSVIIIFSSLQLFAQKDIPVATWRTHLSYNHVIDIALADAKVYCATHNAIFIIDKSDRSIQTITKLDGLSGGEISAIGYSLTYNSLIIGYQTGNIDLIKGQEIINISAIKNDDFTTDKRINNVTIFNDLAYLSTDFGVSIVDLQSSNLKETIVNLGPDKIIEATLYNDSIFLATNVGIMAASLDPNINILDFNNWKVFGSPSTEVASITVAQGKLYSVEKQGSIYQYDEGVWSELSELQGESFVKIRPSVGGLLILTESKIFNYVNGTLTPIDIDLITNANEILQDGEGTIWVADQTNGVVKSANDNSERIVPSGPFSDKVFHIEYVQNEMFVLSGGISNDNLPLERDEGFYKFSDGRWKNFNEAGIGVMTPISRDLTDIAYNALRNQVAISSFQDGVLLVDNDNVATIINQSTSRSSLTSNSVSGIAYANDGLWILNYGQDQSVHHFGDDGVWQSFTLNNSATKYPLDIIVSQNNDKWLRLSESTGGGVFVFNEKSGKQRLLNNATNNGGLPSSKVNALVEDLNGQIWVGTNRGVVYFHNSSDITDNNNVTAIVPRINNAALLRDQNILSIGVDPGNRKWIGTENGLWLFDENGEQEIEYFNIENSPLPSNTILSIDINPSNGEVFFATELGVISYRGTATTADESHQSVKIFPNPISKSFSGLVSISGLTSNAIVKITDVSGKLIRQMHSNGGTATWDVKDYQGNRAETGIYLVFSTTKDGGDSIVGKLAVIN